MAVRALNVEVARIRDVTSEATTAAGRFHFWLEAVEKALKGRPVGHPLARALAAAAGPGSGLRLSPLFLSRLVRARLEDDQRQPFATMAAVEAYAEETASMQLYLTLEAMGITSLDADHAASHIGRAQGIVTLLRGAPYWLTHRQVGRHAPFLLSTSLRPCT